MIHQTNFMRNIQIVGENVVKWQGKFTRNILHKNVPKSLAKLLPKSQRHEMLGKISPQPAQPQWIMASTKNINNKT